MKKSRFKKPYKKGGKKTNFPHTQKKSGVYLVMSRQTKKIVYIGYSQSQLYKTMYRHFEKWPDPTQVRVTLDRDRYLVRVVLVGPKKAAKLEQALIAKYKPTRNPEQVKTADLTKAERAKMDKEFNDYFGEPVDNVPF